MKNGAAFLSTRPRSRPAGRNAIFYCYICPRKNSLNPYAMKPVKTTLRRIGLLLALGAGLGAAAQTTLQNAQGTVRAQLDSAGRLAGGRQLPGRAPGDAVRVVPQEDCVATVYVHMEAETPVTVDFADGPHSARLRQGAVSRTRAARL